MTVGELLELIGRRAPWAKAAEWDPVGLQVGDPSQAANRVAVCHEINEAMVDEAAAYDLVITYHPLLFRPLTRMVAGRSAEGRALRLIAAGTAVASVHTNFDAAAGGTADALVEALGIEAARRFGPTRPARQVKVVTFVPEADADDVTDAMASAGAGHIGAYSHCSYRTRGTGTFQAGEGTSPVVGDAGKLNQEREARIEMVAPQARESAVLSALTSAHPYEEPAFDVYDVRSNAGMVGRVGLWAGTLRELASKCSQALDASARFAGDPLSVLEKVAVVPGAGSEFIDAAGRLPADAIVTGDVSHHRAVAAIDRGVMVVDPGHIPTERPGVEALYAFVSELVPEADHLKAIETHPWKNA